MTSKRIHSVAIVTLLLLSFQSKGAWQDEMYSKNYCPPLVQNLVDHYCDEQNCRPLFSADKMPIVPGYIEEIRQALPKVEEASKELGVPMEDILSALITVQVKGGYRQVSGFKKRPTPISGEFVVASPRSGDSKAYEPTPGSGESKAYKPTPGSGDSKAYTPAPGSGDSKAYTPAPGSGDSKAYTPAPGSGDSKAYTPALGSGENIQEKIEEIESRCNFRMGYSNLARLDHDGPLLAETYLAQLQGRELLSCDALHLAINQEGKDILYLAAMLKRNQEIFEEAQLPYDTSVAVTLYGLADIEGVAKKVAGRERAFPILNSWGLYAACQQPLVEELLENYQSNK